MKRKLTTGWLVAIVSTLALVGWFGVRVRASMRNQGELAAERARAAKAAATETGGKSSRAQAGTPGRWRPVIALEGTLQPARESDLGFKLPGRLQSVRVRLGQKVGAGQVLATLDDTEATAQVAAVRAQVRAAEAQLALADDGVHRMATLAAKNAATEASGVQVGQQQKLAAAQLDGARAALQLAEAALRNHALVTPFAGIVTKVPSGPGSFVAPGVPLFHLSDIGTLKLAANVSEGDASLVKNGATLEVLVDGAKVEGKVVAVLSSVDATRRVPVEAEVKNPGDLRGGAFVRARVLGLDEIDVLKLPATVLRPGSQDEVMVVKNGRLERRRVTFSVGEDASLLIRAGLAPDEKVVIAPPAEAKDGDTLALAAE
jgi:RND family efflux transporter MFP subunit